MKSSLDCEIRTASFINWAHLHIPKQTNETLSRFFIPFVCLVFTFSIFHTLEDEEQNAVIKLPFLPETLSPGNNIQASGI